LDWDINTHRITENSNSNTQQQPQIHNNSRLDWDINRNSLNFGRSDWEINTSLNEAPPGQIGTSIQASANSAQSDWDVDMSHHNQRHRLQSLFFFFWKKEKRKEEKERKAPFRKQPSLEEASLPELPHRFQEDQDAEDVVDASPK
jgi:hypothetical protein